MICYTKKKAAAAKIKLPRSSPQELLRVVGANDRTAVTQLVTVSWNGEADSWSHPQESRKRIYVPVLCTLWLDELQYIMWKNLVVCEGIWVVYLDLKNFYSCGSPSL